MTISFRPGYEGQYRSRSDCVKAPTDSRVFTAYVKNHDSCHYDGDNMNETCCCCGTMSIGKGAQRGRLTRLENESGRDLNVSTVARWFDALCIAYQRAYDKGSRLAYSIERAKGNAHRLLDSGRIECVGAGPGLDDERVDECDGVRSCRGVKMNVTDCVTNIYKELARTENSETRQRRCLRLARLVGRGTGANPNSA